MKAVLQRVTRSSVTVEGRKVAQIGKGLNILLGVMKEDTEEDAKKLVSKIVNLRIFADENAKMNLSLKDIDAEVLVISQFTLAAKIKKGRRPSFDAAMEPKEAKRLYEYFCEQMEKECRVKRGVFAAMMEVEIVNDGPVTVIADSKEI
ncbi:D-tyrosyl-tRNA(Tyr) deacylase [Hydrogenimonas sp.]|nr:D-tyrosyl-tRNA(Tyr) deacylase [Hydrogenimonas sp.]